jgi:ribonuclease III
MIDFTSLEQRIGIVFNDKKQLVNAFVHSSYSNENPDYVSNERLEFLGDAVLGLIIAENLYDLLPGAVEGELTRRRAALISRASLTRLARRIGIGEYLLLGKGEEANNGRSKATNLSGAMEALIGAVYLDRNYEDTKYWVIASMGDDIRKAITTTEETDYKSALQELTQAAGWGTPVYQLTGLTGPDHAPFFTVNVVIEARPGIAGKGKTKKAAEVAAAQNALIKYQNELK